MKDSIPSRMIFLHRSYSRRSVPVRGVMMMSCVTAKLLMCPNARLDRFVYVGCRSRSSWADHGTPYVTDSPWAIIHCSMNESRGCERVRIAASSAQPLVLLVHYRYL